ncbi:hypothetical protein C0J52_09225 [Blattella germanica]|nr:hypothetical protein C0J52_09225 [Blattella germanica]
MLLSTDYAAAISGDPNTGVPCDWSTSGTMPPLILPVPMPTLYSNGVEPGRARLAAGKLSIVELVLYNMAAMLAGVAAGYDVRLSNVSPVHPRLHPDRSEEEQDEKRWWFGSGSNRSSGLGAVYLGADYEFSSASGYPHNTYHGPARHLRPLLNSLGQDPESGTKPLRFTDSPQHYASASPRRKSSSTSNEGSEATYPPPPPAPSGGGLLDHRNAGLYMAAGDYSEGGYSARPELYRTDSYFTGGIYGAVHYVDRLYPDFQGYHPHTGAYDNPSISSVSSSTNSITPHTPSRLCGPGATNHTPYEHHRTPSNVSNASSSNNSSSNVNPSFRLEDEGEYSQYNTPTHHYYTPQRRGMDYEYAPPPPPFFSRQNSHDSNASTAAADSRPGTLEVSGSTRLRSSLKRYNYTPISGTRTGGGGGSSSSGGAGTPTNPTPPDSLTSEDSSYVSAKEGSYSSASRVRFSPVTMMAAETRETLLDIPVQDATVPLQAARRIRRLSGEANATSGRSRKPSISELEREFLS